MCASGVRCDAGRGVQGRVDSVAPDSPQQGGGSGAGGRVTLASGEEVEYDWLVVALGGESSTFGIPGVRELAVPFCTFTDAQQVRADTHAHVAAHVAAYSRVGAAGWWSNPSYRCGTKLGSWVVWVTLGCPSPAGQGEASAAAAEAGGAFGGGGGRWRIRWH